MKINLNKYYFTFGTDKRYPYCGGWVEVYAISLYHAVTLFRNKYLDRTGAGVVNCADYYREELFPDEFFKNGNLGACCHDVIKPEGAYE